MPKEIKIGSNTTSSLTHEEATKALWEAQETIYKTLKTLTGNPACQDIIGALWANVEHISNALKWIRNLHIGSYYKVSDYDKSSYYIVRLDTFIAGDPTIECYCRVLTSTKESIEYNVEVTDFVVLPIATLERKDFNLIIEELPLFTSNIFNGTLLQELLKQ